MRGRLRTQELAVLAALAFMLAAGIYKSYETRRLDKLQQQSQTAVQELQDTLALKALWDDKELRKKAEKLRTLLKEDQLTSFQLKQRSLELQAQKLSGRELNRLMSKLGSLPLQIQSLEISRSNDYYTLECKCKW